MSVDREIDCFNFPSNSSNPDPSGEKREREKESRMKQNKLGLLIEF